MMLIMTTGGKLPDINWLTNKFLFFKQERVGVDLKVKHRHRRVDRLRKPHQFPNLFYRRNIRLDSSCRQMGFLSKVPKAIRQDQRLPL